MPSFPIIPTSRWDDSSIGMIERNQAPDGEIGMANALPGRAQHVANRELDRLAFRQHPSPLAARQCVEQSIDGGGTLNRWHQDLP